MKHLNRVHLNGLRAVEAVGRLGSLKAAADELGVTAGAISQQLQKTEQQLGLTLFERLPRGLRPTENALPVISRLSAGMEQLEAAVIHAQRRQGNTLTVSVAPVFAGKWLVWNLKKFSKQHPDVRVRIDANVKLVDPDLSDVDLCVRIGKGPYPGFRVEKLIPKRIFPVCSPQLAEHLKTPADLAGVPIIHDAGQAPCWDDWFLAQGLKPIPLTDGPTFSDASLCLDAVISGHGVFMAWETLAYHAIETAQVIMPFPFKYETDDSYWLISSEQAPHSHAMQAFSRWLKDELPVTIGCEAAP